jgi:hypothetical protein
LLLLFNVTRPLTDRCPYPIAANAHDQDRPIFTYALCRADRVEDHRFAGYRVQYFG